MDLLLLLSLLMASAIMTSEAQNVNKLTNIDFIGLGYDVLLGNPHSQLPDPGFRHSVFQLSYENQSLSSDGKWMIPDSVQAIQATACSYQSHNDEVTGATSYRGSLSVDASVEGDLWVAKFSASTGYRDVKEGTSKQHKVYIESVAKCSIYKTSVKRDIRLSNDFLKAVSLLSVGNTVDFISDFGTHYASTVVMGAKAVVSSVFEQTAWTRMEQSGLNVKAAASASFQGVVAPLSASSATVKNKNLTDEFEGKRSSKREVYLGSKPSEDGKWQSWAKTSGESPYPISYHLRPLTELMVPQYIPGSTDSDLLKKRELLEEAFKQYCNRLDGCSPPESDLSPVKVDKVESNIKGRQLLSCRPGYSLLSCGIHNMDATKKKWSEGAFRFAHPVNNNTCACYDPMGAKCFAWCTNAVKGFEITESATQEENDGVISAKCSPGKKVLGCHLVPKEGAVAVNETHAFYPSDDMSSCICRDESVGSKCVASCADNVASAEVRKQYERGTVRAVCSDNNYVLGCGMRSGDGAGDGWEQWRHARVTALDSCQCNDFFGATCYATCGHFN